VRSSYCQAKSSKSYCCVTPLNCEGGGSNIVMAALTYLTIVAATEEVASLSVVALMSNN
jgi:hypothetical protein